jgi:hypothetical protein
MVISGAPGQEAHGCRRISLRRAGLACSVLIVCTIAPAHVAASPPGPNGYCPVTAADSLGWGAPNRVDDFNDPSSLEGWEVADGPGHARNGWRTPDALSFNDGTVTITGDAQGNSGHLTWMPGQLYGRWEVCAQSPPGSPNYHSVALLWPDSGNWPADGEIDFMEMVDPARQGVTASLVHRRLGEDDG